MSIGCGNSGVVHDMVIVCSHQSYSPVGSDSSGIDVYCYLIRPFHRKEGCCYLIRLLSDPTVRSRKGSNKIDPYLCVIDASGDEEKCVGFVRFSSFQHIFRRFSEALITPRYGCILPMYIFVAFHTKWGVGRMYNYRY